MAKELLEALAAVGAAGGVALEGAVLEGLTAVLAEKERDNNQSTWLFVRPARFPNVACKNIKKSFGQKYDETQ